MGWETSSHTLVDLARSRGLNPAKHTARCRRCEARTVLGVIVHKNGCEVDLDSIEFLVVQPVDQA